MKMTGHKILFTCFTVCVLMAGQSCRKELCYNHWEHSSSVKADITADYIREWEIDNLSEWERNWDEELFDSKYEDHIPELPGGLRILVYRNGGYEIRNIAPEGELVQLYEGDHSLLFYNNDTEYLLFDNLGTSASAMATTRTRTRFSLDGTDSKTPTRGYNPPDMLYGCYVPSYWGERKYEPDPMPISLRPLVYTYLIVAEFDTGIEYVKKARGELDGVATGVYLQSGTTSEEAGAILFDTDVCRMTDYGIVAPVQSFGIPGYPYEDYASTKADGTFTLTLEVELLNGNTKKYDPVDVTAILEAHPRGGVIRVSGFEVTDEEGTAGGSGFEVDVDGWGDYEDIPLPIG